MDMCYISCIAYQVYPVFLWHNFVLSISRFGSNDKPLCAAEATKANIHTFQQRFYADECVVGNSSGVTLHVHVCYCASEPPVVFPLREIPIFGEITKPLRVLCKKQITMLRSFFASGKDFLNPTVGNPCPEQIGH